MRSPLSAVTIISKLTPTKPRTTADFLTGSFLPLCEVFYHVLSLSEYDNPKGSYLTIEGSAKIR